MESDRNLLFGILALRAEAITPEHFIEACRLWTHQRNIPLADLLVQRGWLDAGHRALVERLLQSESKDSSVANDGVPSGATRLAAPSGTLHLAGKGNKPHGGAAMADAEEPSERYTLTNLHSMGGIGRVWMARDEVLGRAVALKELRPEYTDRPAVVARFVEEAKITGQLEHPNIVPVYELDRRPAGASPAYTMRFIQGRTLSSACKDYHHKRSLGVARALDLRELLGALVAVCNAVAFAHSRGVIHRDLKGQNVVLGNFGEVIVLDWGLAKLKGSADEQPNPVAVTLTKSDSREETVHGQVLGTPGYMAPEQAEGRHKHADERTDVYGLGAILYEILTGRPPFEGGSTKEVLERIAREPPPRPRQLVAATPPALEAICLKGLAKDPAERYVSAKTLSEDVQRYLADEPVEAYADPLSVRAGRWTRRHRAGALAGVAGMVVATLCLVAATVLLEASRERERVARVNAEEQQRLTERERDRAWARFQMARQAVDRYHTRVSESPELKAHGLEGLRTKLLEDAVDFYERLVNENDAGDVEAERGRTYWRLANLYGDTGRNDRGEGAYDRALEIQKTLVAAAPADAERQHDLALTYTREAELYERTGRHEAARTAHRHALAILEALLKDHPDTADYRHDLAENYAGLGLTDSDQRESAWRQSLAIQKKLVADYPENPKYQRLLAGICNDLGFFYLSGATPARAEEPLDEALAIQKKIVAAHPEAPDDEDVLVVIDSNLGFVYGYTNRLDKAEKIYRDAVAISDRLVATHPLVPEFREHRASVYAHLGRLYRKTGRPREAEASYRTCVTQFRTLVRDFPKHVEYQNRLLPLSNRLADLIAAAGRPADAETVWKDSIAVQAKAAAERPDPGLRILGDMYDKLADFERASNRPLEREATRKEAVDTIQKLLGATPGPFACEQLAAAQQSLGDFYRDSKAPGRARPAYESALASCERALRSSADEKSASARAHAIRGNCLAELGRSRQVAEEFARAVELEPANASYWRGLSAAHLALGDVEESRRTCARAWAQLGQTRDQGAARLLLLACVTEPGSTPTAEALVALADRAIPRTNENLGLHGAALYRSGKWSPAAQALAPSAPHQARDSFFMSMVQARLGHADEAGRWLATADALLAQSSRPWTEHAELQALRGESETLLKAAQSASAKAP
jgi:serine/threonine-protein kinase